MYEKAKKKNLQVTKLAKAKGILNDAKKTRKELFDTDSDMDPEVVPITEVKDAQNARNFWQLKYESASTEIERLQKDFNRLEEENKSLQEIAKEVSELRNLNRQLQEKFLSMPAEQDPQTAGPAQQLLNYAEIQGTENFDLGGGVVLHSQTFFDLHKLPDCKKFTKYSRYLGPPGTWFKICDRTEVS
ncbi:hypothetical protein JTE90_012383 [Oedothorax gibbosus]|uniref:Uncharacterized protein n=1 Tax=Oedothorax gibbosus TaxID=931172 RepID=A0AAV6TWK8_9ARAC|nr:hypothetical protein JTE90_012383 [Oedothorax gibbosus]